MKVPENRIPPKIAEYRQALKRNATPAEKRFRKALTLVTNMINVEFEFQSVYHNPVANKYYIVDFVVPFHKLIIEVDGPTHDTDGQKNLDEERDNAFKNNGFRVLRVKNIETRNHINTVKTICESLLKTVHGMKAYSALKKIGHIEDERKEYEKQYKAQLDEAVEVALQRVFEAKIPKSKVKAKSQKIVKKVECSRCGVKMLPNEKQCPECQEIRQVSRKYANKAKPIKSAIVSTGKQVRLRKGKANHQPYT